MPVVRSVSEISLDGGIACLDFANSGYDTQKGVITERLHTYEDVLILAERLALLPKDRIKALRKEAGEKRKEAQTALATMRKVREMMFTVFAALANNQLKSLDSKTLDAFNTYLLMALNQQSFAGVENGLGLTWKKSALTLLQPLWAFLLSAYHLLHEEDQQYIKQCGGCEWLFYDTTKNHRRKWCDMQTCGSLHKSKRYYQRKKKLQ